MKRKIILILIFIVCTLIPTASATFVEMEKTHTPDQLIFPPDAIFEFNITLTVRVEEGGAVLPIENLKIRDKLPDGLTYVIASQTSSIVPISFTDFLNGTLLWDFGPGPFTSEPHVTVSFNVSIDPDAPRGPPPLVNEGEAFYEEVTGIISSPSVSDFMQVSDPSINLLKEVSTSSAYELSNITYTYTVTNTGDIPLFNVIVYDETLALIVLGPTTLTAGANESAQYTLYDQSAGTYVNTAIATGEDAGGYEVTDTDDATCNIESVPDVGGNVIEAVSDSTRLNIALVISFVTLLGYIQVKRPT